MGIMDYGKYFTGRESEPIYGADDPLAQQAQQYSEALAKAEEEARFKRFERAHPELIKQREDAIAEYNRLEAEARAAGRPVFAWRGTFAPVRPETPAPLGDVPVAPAINSPVFQPGEMSTGAPEDFNPLTQGPVSTPPLPPAGPAASINPPPAPGRIMRGPKGEVMLGNLADAGKPLEMAEAKRMVAESGPMRFSNDMSGQVATITPGGPGSYYYGGDRPSLTMTHQQVADDPNLNPGQKAAWYDEKNREFEAAMRQAALEKLKAEAYGISQQGGLYGAQGRLYGEQEKGLEQRRSMSPEETGYRQSTIPLENYIYQNMAQYEVRIAPYLERIYIGMLAANPKLARLAAKDPAVKQQIRDAAKVEAIQAYVKDHQEDLMIAQARSGMVMGGIGSYGSGTYGE